MNLLKFKPIIEVAVISIIAICIHKLLFILFVKPEIENSFYFTPLQLFTFFVLSSFIVVLILIIVKENNIDNVGYTFLLLTFIKMGIAYIFLTKIIENASFNLPKEKINFFITFAVFLTIETTVTIRILNKKQ